MYQLFPQVHVSSTCLFDVDLFSIKEKLEIFIGKYGQKEKYDGKVAIKYFFAGRLNTVITQRNESNQKLITILNVVKECHNLVFK